MTTLEKRYHSRQRIQSRERICAKVNKNKADGFRLVFSISLIISVFIVVSPFINGESYNDKKYTTVMVQSGDSLWSIASEFAPNDTQNMIREIIELNKLNSNILLAQTPLKVPVE